MYPKLEYSFRAICAPLLLLSTLGCGTQAQREAPVLKSQVAKVYGEKHGKLTRFGTISLGAEVTGIVVAPNGDFFFNVQHPSDSNRKPFDQALIGVVAGVNMNQLPKQFDELPLPANRKEKEGVRVALGEYHIVASQGDKLKGLDRALGQFMDVEGKKVVTDSDKPDLNAFIPGNSDNKGYLFTNWESIPGGMSRLTMTRGKGGRWTVDEAMMVDFSAVGGTFANCFGTLSPWGTPLTSEEFFLADTRNWNNPQMSESAEMKTFSRHIGRFPNPYRYGYIVEIQDPLSDNPKPVKHYAMGRYSHENSVVMPDRKTAYLSDDDAAAGFFKFIADKEDDLSAGTLYVARVTQDRDPDGALIRDASKAGFDITWLKLAHGSSDQIEQWIAAYDNVDRREAAPGKTLYLDPKEVEAWAKGKAADDRALFLETRRAAELRGGSIEFCKLEGVVINYPGAASGKVPWLYAAISNVSGGMADDKGDIQLDKNICGVVYRMRLDANYNVHRMEPLVTGGPYDATSRWEPCPNNNIANPDNLQVLPDGRVIIVEDGYHENAMLWIFEPAQN